MSIASRVSLRKARQAGGSSVSAPGRSPGRVGALWTRRAKVPLFGIPAKAVRRALETGTPLVARVAGTAKDGGPFFASVPLLVDWEL